MRVRQAVHADAPMIVGVARRAIIESCTADHENDAARLDAWLENKTEQDATQWIDSTKISIFVLEDDGVIRATAAMSRNGFVSLMFVDPAFQRRGYGTALMMSIEQTAMERGYDSLVLESTSGAVDYYKKHGFIQTDDESIWRGIRCFPMRKPLSPQAAPTEGGFSRS